MTGLTKVRDVSDLTQSYNADSLPELPTLRLAATRSGADEDAPLRRAFATRLNVYTIDQPKEQLFQILFLVSLAKFIERSGIQHFAAVDDRHAVANLFDFAEVVCRVDHALAAFAQRLHLLQHRALHQHVQPVGRLIENQHRGIMNQGAGDGHLLFLPGAHLRSAHVANVVHTQNLEQVGDPVVQLLPRKAVELAIVFDHLAGGHAIVDASSRREETDVAADFIGMCDNVETGDAGRAGSRFEKRAEYAKRRGLAGAVGAEQPEDFAGAGGERDAVHGLDGPAGRVAERFAKAGDFDHIRDDLTARGEEGQSRLALLSQSYHKSFRLEHGIVMADIRAFRGFRYDLGRAGPLSDLIAPPYDVVDPALQQALYDRSPYNAIRVELTRDEPDDTPTRNRYTRAGQTLSGWQIENVLQQDTLRSLYAIEQEFTVEGTTHRRRGFIARVRLEPYGTGRIFPHEETMSGPKEDRLKLFRATGMNVSPIFSLYPDSDNAVFAKLEAQLRRMLPLEARDHLGVISRLWPVTDEHTIGTVVSAMTDKPVFIADGHHRYETSLRYLDEARAAGMVVNDDAPANFVMMMLVSMADPGLVILPTHRIVSGFRGLTAEKLQTALGSNFAIERVGSGREAWEAIELDGSQALLGFHTQVDGFWQLARLANPNLMAELATSHSEDWRDLAVSVLHVAVLDRLLPKTLGGSASCKFVHLLREVDDAIRAGMSDLAVLVPPARMEHVEHIAGNHEKMPPKSTYFYPKLLTGLVFNSLKAN